jgi:hypothetical protein
VIDQIEQTMAARHKFDFAWQTRMKLRMSFQQIQGNRGAASTGASDKYRRKILCHALSLDIISR